MEEDATDPGWRSRKDARPRGPTPGLGPEDPRRPSLEKRSHPDLGTDGRRGWGRREQ